MQLSVYTSKTVAIEVRGSAYPVTISGIGIPSLIIGIGTLMQRTLSERFRKSFMLYSGDMYWDRRNKLHHASELTMEHILDDNAEIAYNLNLSSFVIIAHSAYGIVALEFAKKYPSLVRGIIMIGTPPNSNTMVAAQNNEYFEKHAEPIRKIIDAERRQRFAEEDLSTEDAHTKFVRCYVYRDAPRYWYIPDFDCSALWEDIILDDVIDHFFSTVLPATDVREKLETVKCPIFLAAGESDYDCCPFLWHKIKNLPPRILISHFKKSGHWPHYEEQDLFDQRVECWIQANNLC